MLHTYNRLSGGKTESKPSIALAALIIGILALLLSSYVAYAYYEGPLLENDTLRKENVEAKAMFIVKDLKSKIEKWKEEHENSMKTDQDIIQDVMYKPRSDNIVSQLDATGVRTPALKINDLESINRTQINVNHPLRVSTLLEREDFRGISIPHVLHTDTITEYTLGAGTEVEGVLLRDGKIYTDTIQEKTTGAGVMIDGVLIKDSIISSNNIDLSAVNQDVVPDTDGTRDLGTTTKRWAETYTDAVSVTNNITVGGTVDGRDIATDGSTLDTLNTNLGDITSAEADQLENIGATTISAAQWQYIGNLDQDLITTSNVTFNNVTVTGTLTSVNELEVDDPILKLNNGATDDAFDIGFYGQHESTSYSGLVRDTTDNYWTFFDSITTEPTTTVSIGTSYGYLRVGHIAAGQNSTYDIGASGTRWANIYADALDATSITGTLQTAAQTNITSLGSLTGLTMAGDLNMGTNDITNATTVTATNLSGTLTTAAQGNITSLGTLPNVDIDGGTIDGTPIGQVSPSVGNFTNLNSNVRFILNNANWSINNGTITGSLLSSTNNTVNETSLSAVTTHNFHAIDRPTYTCDAAITTTNASTMYIAGNVIQGANANITNNYSLWVDQGDVRFDDFLLIGSISKQPDTLVHTYLNNTNVASAIKVEQDGGGDASMAFHLSGGVGYAIGIDNSDAQKFKITYVNSATAPDLEDLAYMTIDTSGNTTLGGNLDMGTNNITNATTVTATNLAGTLTTAAQGNVTSVGTLTSLDVGGNITITGTVDGRDVAGDGADLDALTSIGLSALTSAEVDQLENIGATTISAAQWGYLGAMNQPLDTTGSVQFVSVTDGTATLTSGGLTGLTELFIYEDNTDVTSAVKIEQDGTGDASLAFHLTGGVGYAMGVDNSDSDKFKITYVTGVTAPDLEDTAYLTIDTAGNMTLGGNLDMGTNNITNATTVTATNLGGTLTTAAQGNVTSLGTLTALQVDNINLNGSAITYSGTDNDIIIPDFTANALAITTGTLEIIGFDTSTFRTLTRTIVPYLNSIYDIGDSSTRFDNIYADNLDAAVSLNVGSGIIDAQAAYFNIGSSVTPTLDSTYNFGSGGKRWLTIYADTLNAYTVTDGFATMTAGNISMPDNKYLTLGTGSDATIGYDGTNLVINPQAVGSGDTVFDAGNVGIGTSPSATLHVLDTTEQLRLGYDASNYCSFTVDSSGDLDLAPTSGVVSLTDASCAFEWGPAAGALARLSYWDATTATISAIDAATNIMFRTNAGVTMYLSEDGNVGIGVASTPATTLHIQADKNYGNGGASASSADLQLMISGTNTNQRLVLGYDTTDNYGVIQALERGTAYRSLLLNPSGGNVGIGASTVDEMLHIEASSGTPAVKIQNTAANGGARYRLQNDARTWDMEVVGAASDYFAITDNTAVSRRLIIDTSGNVGIGTTSPKTRLHLNAGAAALAAYTPNGREALTVQGNTAGSVIGIVEPSANTGEGEIWFNDITGGIQGRLRYEFDLDRLEFWAGGIERMAIDSSGNVGIGESSPSANLHVTNGSLKSASLTYDADAHAIIQGEYVQLAMGMGYDANAYGFWIQSRYNNNTAYKLVINPLGGDVSIGTSQPDTNCKLHIVGDSGGDTSDAALLVEGTSTSYFQNATALFTANTNRATVRIRSETNDASELAFDVNGAIRWMWSTRTSGDSYCMRLYPQHSTPVYTAVSDYVIQIEQGGDMILRAGHFYCGTDNYYDLGTSSKRWDDIYATNATIQTSDVNSKENIVSSDLGLDFINQLRPVSYKWKDYTSTKTYTDDDGKEFTEEIEHKHTRTHYGLIAQEVKTTLDNLEKTPVEFAGWTEDDEGKQGLRYSELIAPMIKAIQELSGQVATLTARIEELES